MERDFAVALREFLSSLNAIYSHVNLSLLIQLIDTDIGAKSAYTKFVRIMVPYADDCYAKKGSYLARLEKLFPAVFRIAWKDVWASIGRGENGHANKEAMWKWLIYLLEQALPPDESDSERERERERKS